MSLQICFVLSRIAEMFSSDVVLHATCICYLSLFRFFLFTNERKYNIFVTKPTAFIGQKAINCQQVNTIIIFDTKNGTNISFKVYI